jgi:hypothetical protein
MPGVQVVTIRAQLHQMDDRGGEADQQSGENDCLAGIYQFPNAPHKNFLSLSR